MSFGEVLPEPGTEIKSFLLIQRGWQDFSTCCNPPSLLLTPFMKERCYYRPLQDSDRHISPTQSFLVLLIQNTNIRAEFRL